MISITAFKEIITETGKIKGLECILLVDDDVAMSFVHERAIRTAVNENTYIHCLHRAKEALDFITYNSVFSSGNDLPRPGLILLHLSGKHSLGFLDEYSKLPDETKEKSVVILLNNSGETLEDHTVKNHPNLKGYLQESLTAEIVRKLVGQHFE